MTRSELFKFLIIFKKRPQILGIRDIVRRSVFKFRYQSIKINSFFFIRKICGAYGNEELCIVRKHDILVLKIKSLYESFSEFGEVFQRSAEEGDLTFDRMSACKSGYHLIYYSLKDGCSNISCLRAVINKRLYVSLCKNPAS